VILLTIVPVWRWARLHIHQVVYAQDAADVEVIGQINASLDGARWQPSVLTTIAEPIARTSRSHRERPAQLVGESLAETM